MTYKTFLLRLVAALFPQGGVQRELSYKGESKRDALSILLRYEIPPEEKLLPAWFCGRDDGHCWSGWNFSAKRQSKAAFSWSIFQSERS